MINLLSERVIISLCWTLIHSLWQGFILASMAAVFIQLAKRAKPQTRYITLLLLFSVQLILSATTFIVTFSAAEPALPISAAHLLTRDFALVTQFVGDGSGDGNGFLSIELFLNDHASIIVNGWFFIMTLLFIRMVAGVLYLKKLRSAGTVDPGSYWQQCIEKIAQSANVQRPVQLLESKLVKAPMIIGYLKPLILLPIGLLNDYQLSQSQLEAILCHEIAHIRRHDYLVNIFQTMAELIFFFNPFVWWMSSLLRDEREYCCDAEVVNRFSDKRTMVEALVSFQESKIRTATLAMGFGGGGKYKLLQRAKRIFYEKNDGISLRTKTVLSGCFVVFFIGVMTIYSQGQQHQGAKTGVFSSQPKEVVDTIPTNNSLRKDSVSNEKEVGQQNEMLFATKEELKLKEEKLSQQREELRQQEEKLFQQEEKLKLQAEKLKQQEEKLQHVKFNITGAQGDKAGDDVIGKIKDDLVANKIVTNLAGVSFKLSYEEFIVNGVAQSPAILKLFYDKYVGNIHTIYYCNWSND